MAQVAIYGLRQTKRLMKEIAPDLRKEMDRTIRKDILNPIVVEARRNVPNSPPLSGWASVPSNPDSRRSYSPYGQRWNAARTTKNGQIGGYERLRWDPDDMRRKIKIYQGGGRAKGTAVRAAWQIRSMSPAAAVYELMGRGKSNVPMVSTTMRFDSRTGRILYRAWDDMNAESYAPQQVEKIIRHYEHELNMRLQNISRTAS